MYFSFCLLILAIANIVAISSTNLYSMAVPGKDISVSIGVFKSDFSHIIKNVDSCLVTNIGYCKLLQAITVIQILLLFAVVILLINGFKKLIGKNYKQLINAMLISIVILHSLSVLFVILYLQKFDNDNFFFFFLSIYYFLLVVIINYVCYLFNNNS